jgi:lipopolysaccharide heptosyltransferase I
MNARRLRLAPAECRRVLVVKMSSLGDILHALPTVHAFRAAGVGAVDWVVQSEYAEVARWCPDVERVIAFPRREFRRGWPAFLRELRRERYDLIVDLQGLLKSAAVARLARGGPRLGPSFHREGARLFYSAVAGPRRRDRHAVDECLDALRALGWPEPEGPPVFPLRRLPFPEPEAPRPRLAFCARSRWPSKNWPVENFMALGRRLLETTGGRIYLFGGAADAEPGARLAAGIGAPDRVRDLCGRTTLAELAAWMGGMDLAVTVDSGPMHLAAALGVPVLALFGPTDPVRTGPVGTAHRVLRFSGLPCSPCLAGTCARGDLACLRHIFPSAVARAVLEMLAEGPR